MKRRWVHWKLASGSQLNTVSQTKKF